MLKTMTAIWQCFSVNVYE